MNTDKALTQNNKIIAEFMGFETYQLNGYLNVHYSDDNIRTIQDTYYHSDWNWLMEVVEKIESLEVIDRMGRFNVNTKNFDENYTSFITDNDNEFIQCEGESKKEAIYNACIDFIKWYNQNK